MEEAITQVDIKQVEKMISANEEMAFVIRKRLIAVSKVRLVPT